MTHDALCPIAQPTAVALLSEDTVSNAPAMGLGREDPDVPSLDVE